MQDAIIGIKLFFNCQQEVLSQIVWYGSNQKLKKQSKKKEEKAHR